LIVTYDLSTPLEPSPSGSVVSIGVFDGVHLGHQAILAANLTMARQLGALSTVVTFGEHPKQTLLGRAPRTLTSLRHRLELFRRAGVEQALVLHFDNALRSIEAEEFVTDLLVPRLAVRAFVMGFDSKFGRNRRGGAALLRELGYETLVVDKVLVGQRPVSSSAIREAVELGDLDGARSMLGRPVSCMGTAVRGDRLGSRLGFPTANLNLHHELHPPCGVYACRARLIESPLAGVGFSLSHPAVANIGHRPTVSQTQEHDPTVEVHLIDFDASSLGGDLYGAVLEVDFERKIRDERRFESLQALAAGIANDIAQARSILGMGLGMGLGTGLGMDLGMDPVRPDRPGQGRVDEGKGCRDNPALLSDPPGADSERGSRGR
jgi:riboflavin kinase/FMN adenylyltransferase